MRALTVASPMGDNSRKAPTLRLAAFDMDGVLIDHVSSWAAVHDALGTTNTEAVAAYLAGAIDDHEFIRRDVRLWRSARPDFSHAQLLAILGDVPRMPGLGAAVQSLRERGTVCAIVSGGLRAMAQMLATEAEFSHIRANDVVFGADGRLTDGAVVQVPMRDKAGVVRALQEELGIGPEETAAIGDSRFDLGMFERSRVRVAFNPIDEDIVRTATHVVRRKDLRRAVEPLLDGATRT